MIATGAGTASAGPGFTARLNSADALGGGLAEDRIVAAAGSYAASATLQTDTLWGVQTIVFRGASDTQPPSVPTALTVSAVSSSQINLSWAASTDNVGVTGYLIERCQGAGCSTFTQVGTPTGTTFNDTGLFASTSYTYRVRARDAVPNLSAYSSTVSATTQAALDTQAPSTPAGLTATAVSGTQINLSWSASTDNVGVVGYRVERCQGAGCSSFTQVGAPTGTTFSDTSVAASTSYTYRVRAVDAVPNLSGYSATATVSTVGAPSGTAGNVAYQYDSFGRLKQVTVTPN